MFGTRATGYGWHARAGSQRERRRRPAVGLAVVVMMTTSVGAGGPASAASVTKAPVVAFQAAGDVGGGVLEPGSLYPPTTHGFATLKRGSDWVQVNINTSGLPAGAYTVWWVVFDNPEGCHGGCGEDDLFNEQAKTSVFFAAGGIVKGGGTGAFAARHRAGDALGEPGTQHILGDGSLHTDRAEIHNVIKYHGPASDDPAVLEAQVTTLQGGCDSGANAVDLGEPFGVQCFDPQAVAHPLP